MEGLAFRLQPVLVLLYMSAQGRGSIHLYDYSIPHVHIRLMPTIATCNVINDLMLWLQAEIISRHLQACMPICSVPTITNCDIIINGLMVQLQPKNTFYHRVSSDTVQKNRGMFSRLIGLFLSIFLSITLGNIIHFLQFVKYLYYSKQFFIYIVVYHTLKQTFQVQKTFKCNIPLLAFLVGNSLIQCNCENKFCGHNQYPNEKIVSAIHVSVQNFEKLINCFCYIRPL